MQTTIQQETPAVTPATLTLDTFFEHVRDSNPFAINRVVPSSSAKEDAPQVHEKQYTRLVELAYRVQKQHVGIGVMLWGEAGIGKSHLLARLGNWAGPDYKQAIFVYLANLQAQPELLPRSLLKCVVSILTRGRIDRFHETPLYRLVRAAVQHALPADNTRTPSMKDAETAYHRLIDDLCTQTPAYAAVVDRTAYQVLFRFFRSVYEVFRGRPDDGTAAAAVRWLAGDHLDPEEARNLGIPLGARREDPVALTDDDQIKRVLAALAQLAWYCRQPLIVCFDQADNLESEQLSALTRFLHALLDCAVNLLVITSGVRETVYRWASDGIIHKAAWDRLGQYEIELQRVSVQEARQIVQVRLELFQEPFFSLAPVKDLIQKDYLFPLGEKWVQEFLTGKIDLRPRDVISWASEGWRRQQGTLKELGGHVWLKHWESRMIGPIMPPPDLTLEEIQQRIDEKVALKLQEHKRQRQLTPETLPPDGDNLAGLLHTLLQRCSNVLAFDSLLGVERLVKPKYGQRPAYDLVLRQRFGPDGKEIRSGLLCLVVSNLTSMASYLRRLVQDTQAPNRLFLIMDERRLLTPATAGQQYLNQLHQRYSDQFWSVRLPFDQYAELEALQATVGLARSGDLEIELPGGRTRRVSEQEVVDSHHRQQRYLAHPLLRLLLTEGASPAPKVPVPDSNGRNGFVPDDKDLREFIMARLGLTMGSSSNELATHYQEYLRHKQVQVDLAVCKSRLEEAAKQLHQAGKLNATPHDDYLYLLSK
jgi:hypothetical protein